MTRSQDLSSRYDEEVGPLSVRVLCALVSSQNVIPSATIGLRQPHPAGCTQICTLSQKTQPNVINQRKALAGPEHCQIMPTEVSLQFARSSESTFTGSDLDSDTYQVAEKAKKLANEVTVLAGQLQTTRSAEQRRPLMPLVCLDDLPALCHRWRA